MSKNSKNSVKEPAEERTPAPQPKALNQTAIDPMYIGRLAGTLLGICLVTALLLGAVNQVTKPRIDAAQKAKTEAAMAQVLPADAYERVDTDAPASRRSTGPSPAGPRRALWRRSPPPGARDLSTWWWAWTPPAR